MQKIAYTFFMVKKLLSVAALCMCLTVSAGCDVSAMSSLTEISRPYTGEYRCEKLLLGGKDELDRFEWVKLNLAYGGKFTLRYRGAEGNEGSYAGEYEVSPTGETITFSAKKGLRKLSQTFPVQKGAIVVDWTFGGKLLHAEFCMP